MTETKPTPSAAAATEDAPRPADVDLLRQAVALAGRRATFGRVASLPLRRGWLDLAIEGQNNVPRSGGVLLAANHLAFIDSLLVMYALPRPVLFLGKSEYLDHPIARRLFPAAGMLPLDRSGRYAKVTLTRAHEVLRDGGIIGVHPEGTRSRDGLLGPGHHGVAQLALRSDVPVVPVALLGTGSVQPPGQPVPQFRGRVTIRFGAPIGTGPWAASRRTAAARAEMTEEIMVAIAALSGQRRRAESSEADLSPAPDSERTANLG